MNVLRKIAKEDLDGVHIIMKQIFGSNAYDRVTISKFCNSGNGYVMVSNGFYSGFTLHGMHPSILSEHKFKEVPTISCLGVVSAYRKMGVGSVLLQTVIKSYPKQDVYLHVRVRNQAALKLYNKEGFHIVADLPDYYGDPPDNGYFMVHPASDKQILDAKSGEIVM